MNDNLQTKIAEILASKSRAAATASVANQDLTQVNNIENNNNINTRVMQSPKADDIVGQSLTRSTNDLGRAVGDSVEELIDEAQNTQESLDTATTVISQFNTQPSLAKGLKGDRGERGITPNITISAHSTDESNPKVVQTGTAENPNLQLFIPKGAKGDRGLQGITGMQGVQGIQGPKGEKGDKGEPFRIAKAFDSFASMSLSKDLVANNFYIIANDQEQVDNAQLYFYDGANLNFVVDMSGLQGLVGATPEISISATALPTGVTPTVTKSGSVTNPKFNIGIPKGDKGAQGERGLQGIQGPKGDKGDIGSIFTPNVSSSGTLSWTNNGNLQNPTAVNIKGDRGEKGDKGDRGEKGDLGDIAVWNPKGIWQPNTDYKVNDVITHYSYSAVSDEQLYPSGVYLVVRDHNSSDYFDNFNNYKYHLIAGLQQFKIMGEWASDVQYDVTSSSIPMVSYRGNTYIAMFSNIGQNPTQTTDNLPISMYWYKIASKGNDGKDGLNFAILGTVDTVEQLPSADSVEIGAHYYVGETAPRDVYSFDGEVWTNQGQISSGGNGGECSSEIVLFDGCINEKELLSQTYENYGSRTLQWKICKIPDDIKLKVGDKIAVNIEDTQEINGNKSEYIMEYVVMNTVDSIYEPEVGTYYFQMVTLGLSGVIENLVRIVPTSNINYGEEVSAVAHYGASIGIFGEAIFPLGESEFKRYVADMTGGEGTQEYNEFLATFPPNEIIFTGQTNSNFTPWWSYNGEEDRTALLEYHKVYSQGQIDYKIKAIREDSNPIWIASDKPYNITKVTLRR